MVPAYLFGPPSSDPAEAATVILPECSLSQARSLQEELQGNHELFSELNCASFAVRRRRIGWVAWYDFLYILVRSLKPEIMVETGVFDGLSSSVTLAALRQNAAGRLISIDLPATDTIVGSTEFMSDTSLPPGHDPGWMIPKALRERHELLLGDARELLPRVLLQHPKLDIFMHDSLHTDEHMTFEFVAAWPHIRDGGLLLSDDIQGSAAFHRFCGSHKKRYLQVRNFGAIRK